jgi:mannose-P-dolichol utilization defect 1
VKICVVLIVSLHFRQRVPQIAKVYQQKSSVGISINSYNIEVVSYAISTMYNFTNGYRVINYFEYVVLLVQDYILMFFVLCYRNQINTKTISLTILYFFVNLMFGLNILPKTILTFLIVSCEEFANDK